MQGKQLQADPGSVQLLPLDEPELLERAAGWIARPENGRWLDFGGGVRQLAPANLKVMSQRELHVLRAFTNGDGRPIGLVALSDVHPRFKTASPWFLLGEKDQARKGHTTRAVAEILTYGFRDLGLRSVLAWTVETNTPSIRLLERLRFRFVGRRRRCHVIDGRTLDRLFFDLLAHEHREEV